MLRRIEADAPAVFLYAPAYAVAVHRRFSDVTHPARVVVARAVAMVGRSARGSAGRAGY